MICKPAFYVSEALSKNDQGYCTWLPFKRRNHAIRSYASKARPDLFSRCSEGIKGRQGCSYAC